jgi:hypothetical protein
VPAYSTRQILTTFEVGAAKEKQIVGATLVLPDFVLAMHLKLVMAQRLNHFSLLARLAKALAAGISQALRLNQFLLQVMAPLPQHRIAQQMELQFSRAHPGLKLKQPLPCIRSDPGIQFLNLALQCEDVLVGLMQPQFLLMFQILPQPQYAL